MLRGPRAATFPHQHDPAQVCHVRPGKVVERGPLTSCFLQILPIARRLLNAVYDYHNVYETIISIVESSRTVSKRKNGSYL
jgi:hypothetical protein